MASSSSSSVDVRPKRCKYGVFLNFRGKDTRDGFLSFLYDALDQRGIRTYLDSVELEKGADISTILDAIHDSNIAVVVFSADYASSPWCLDELVKIMDCRQNTGLQVLIVFYRVNPEDVENQSGSFSEAFDQHQQCNDKETIEKWRIALKTAVSISGWDYASREIRNESALVKKIVADIMEKLRYLYFSNDFKGLVGMHSRVEDIESLLFSGNVNDVRFVGIWGMGGIGKTTLAKAIFDKYSAHFESSYFLANVREASEKSELSKLRDELLASLPNRANKRIRTSTSSSTFSMNQFQHTKTLIVLDDVNKFEQIEYLAEKHEWFGEGSRVIVTSRDRQVLKNGVDIIYEAQQLNGHEALQLFSLFAFKQIDPLRDYLELSNRALKYARGLPLALKVLGLFLYDRSKEEWESAVNELQVAPNMEVHELLKISFNGLDPSAKEIFLHIACFFKGRREKDVERILHSCGYSAKIGLSKLADKALIVISNSNVEMHDLLEEMGREIIRRESVKEPGKRSRLWDFEDMRHVLEKKTGTETVEAISSFYLLPHSPCICVDPTAFSKMESVKMLTLVDGYRLYCPRGLESLPRELRYLEWHSYPLKALPSNVYFENLVELHMPCSEIERLWTGKQNLSCLRVMRMRHSYYLIEMPDFSGALKLEILDFRGCEKLLEVSSSIEYLQNLKDLDVGWCAKIKSVPSIKGLRSLTKLNLGYCCALEKLSDLSDSIEELDLSHTIIKEVPSCSELRSLRELDLSYCSRLQKFPELSTSVEKLYLDCRDVIVPYNLIEHLSRLQTLRMFHLSGRGNIRGIDLGRLSLLRELDLSQSAFEYIPDSIKHLSCLEMLNLFSCKRLRLLPELPPHLTELDASFCASLEMITESRFALMETSGKLLNFNVNFDFFDCHQLNENARRNISNHAKQIIGLFVREALYQLPKSVGRKGEATFLYPGNEIPDWVNHQSIGSSITVELPGNLRDPKNLLGFVICVIFDEAAKSLALISLACECHFEFNEGTRNLELHFKLPGGGHVLLSFSSSWHQARVSSLEEEYYYQKATFCFYLESLGNQHGRYVPLEVSKCGVRLLYMGD